MRTPITSPSAKAVGPYSHAVNSDGLIFLSGQIPIDPATGELVPGGLQEQARQSFANMFAVLEAGGMSSDDVEKVTVFLTDMNDFAAMNEVYQKMFNAPYPARSAVGVAALPKGARIEIECIARKR